MKSTFRLLSVLANCAALMTLAACQCSYTVAPTSSPAVAAGVNIPVNVTASSSTCAWQYQANDPWLTVGPDPDNTGQTGKGNGRVLVTVAPWRAARSSNLEDTVNLTSGGSGGTAEERFGTGTATIGYQVKAKTGTSPWPTGGGDIVVRDSANQEAGKHHVDLQ